MATFNRVNGAAYDFQATGRELQLVSLSKSSISQAEVNSVVQYIQLTCTVVALDKQTNVAYALVEGPAVDIGANVGGVTGVTSALVATFAN